MHLIQDLPIEILRIILKSLDPLSIKNCMLTCNKWKEVIAHYIFQPYLRKLVKDENLKFSLKRKIKRKGWIYDCIDYDLITSLYEELRFYKARILVSQGDRLSFNKETEIIDLFDYKASFSFKSFGNRPEASTGGLLEGKPVICGGAKLWGDDVMHIYKEMYEIVTKNEGLSSLKHGYEKMLQKRVYSASVIVNESKVNSKLWVTGGQENDLDSYSTLNNSEFVFFEKDEKLNLKRLISVKGPDLPFTICQHGMAKIKENSIYIIGGRQNDEISRDVWIVDPTNEYSIKKGPLLNTPRYDFSCGTMRIDGKMVIIIAGGFTKSKTFLDSVEILDPMSDQGWIPGPKLPYKMVGTSMVTSPGGNGVILIGGLVTYTRPGYDDTVKVISDQLWELKAKAKEWVMLKQKLQNARYYSTAIPLYDEWGQSISGIDQKFIFNDESDAFPSKKKSRQSI